MKKSSVIAIGLIFLASIVLVGFFGIRLKIFDPVVYVEKIEWNYSEFNDESKFRVTLYSEEEKLANNYEYDAELKYISYVPIEDLTFNFKCYGTPLNATNSKLTYKLNINNSKIVLNVKDDNTADITFNMMTSVNLIAKSSDGRDVTYTIKIDILEVLI